MQQLMVLDSKVEMDSPFGFEKLMAEKKNRQLLELIKYASSELSRGKNFDQTFSSAFQRFPIAKKFFKFDPGHISESLRLRQSLLYPRNQKSVDLSFSSKRNRHFGLQLTFSGRELRVLARLLEGLAFGFNREKRLLSGLSAQLKLVYRELNRNGFVAHLDRGCARNKVSDKKQSGLFRLQHAGLVFQGIKSKILVDPVFFSRFGRDHTPDPFPLHRIGRDIDAILITHSHEDHFHLPTLMSLPKSTPIIIPKVPKGSILCRDICSILKQIGYLNVLELDWYSKPVRIGEFEIFSLPFFGEQPTLRNKPHYDNCRNWGNTYLLKRDGETAWILVDSGSDYSGDMRKVAEYVKTEFGPIDYLIGHLDRTYINPAEYITGGTYWLTLSPKEMQNFHKMKSQFITLGPEGVADVAMITQAKTFLPYANFWQDLSIEEQRHEKATCNELKAELILRKAKTRLQRWKVGDFLAFTSGRICPYPRSQNLLSSTHENLSFD